MSSRWTSRDTILDEEDEVSAERETPLLLFTFPDPTCTMPPATDPDRLVFFLNGSNAASIPDSRHPRDHRTLRAWGILDSLARLLVNEKQTFAIAVVPDIHQARFIIAENNLVPPEVRNHLSAILQSLYAARQLVLAYPGAQCSPPPALVIPIPRDTTDPLHRKLLELEVSVFRHSWPKMRKRLFKSRRDETFTEVCSESRLKTLQSGRTRLSPFTWILN